MISTVEAGDVAIDTSATTGAALRQGARKEGVSPSQFSHLAHQMQASQPSGVAQVQQSIVELNAAQQRSLEAHGAHTLRRQVRIQS